MLNQGELLTTDRALLKRAVEMYGELPEEQKTFLELRDKRYIGACLASGLKLATVCDTYNFEPKSQESQMNRYSRISRAKMAYLVYKNLTDIGFDKVFLQGHNKFDAGSTYSIELDYTGDEQLIQRKYRGRYAFLIPGKHKFFVTSASIVDRRTIERAKKEKVKDPESYVYLTIFEDAWIPKPVYEEIKEASEDEMVKVIRMKQNKQKFYEGMKGTVGIKPNREITAKTITPKTSLKLSDTFGKSVEQLIRENTTIDNPDEINLLISNIGEVSLKYFYASGMDLNMLARYMRGENTRADRIIPTHFAAKMAKKIGRFNSDAGLEFRGNDFSAKLKGTEPFHVVLANGDVVDKNFTPGDYTIKTITSENISSDIINEAVQMKNYSDNIIFLTSAETQCSDTLQEKLASVGAEIYRTNYSSQAWQKVFQRLSDSYQYEMSEIERRQISENRRKRIEQNRLKLFNKRASEKPVFKNLCDEVRERLPEDTRENVQIDKLVCVLGESIVKIALGAGYNISELYEFISEGFNAATYARVSRRLVELHFLKSVIGALGSNDVKDIRYQDEVQDGLENRACFLVDTHKPDVSFLRRIKHGYLKKTPLEVGTHRFITHVDRKINQSLFDYIIQNRQEGEKVHIVLPSNHKPIIIPQELRENVDIIVLGAKYGDVEKQIHEYRSDFLKIRNWESPIEYFSVAHKR